ncbi:hypothetical protein GALL_363940 [mine drainage metagenome]|uniref:Uncharacterized protein n=1 Tax=mine drainage metagenome TaxID=410659 RepID=A0A1J5QF38_9ZZZZ
MDHLAQPPQRRLVEVDRVERARAHAAEQPQYDVLETVHGRHRDHAQLDVGPPEAGEIDLAVLRLAVLGDVEVGHDLQPRHQRVTVARGQLEQVAQLAVDAQPDLDRQRRLGGLDVDVRRALFDRLRDHPVHQLHQHAVGFAGQLDAGLGAVDVVLRQLGGDVVETAARRLHLRLRLRLRLRRGVGARQRRGHAAGRGDHRAHLQPGQEAQLALHVAAIPRVVEGDDQAAVAHHQRQNPLAARERRRHPLQRVGLGREVGQVDVAQAQPVADHRVELILRDHAFLDQHAPQTVMRQHVRLALEQLGELADVEQAALDQRFAEVVRRVDARLTQRVPQSVEPGRRRRRARLRGFVVVRHGLQHAAFTSAVQAPRALRGGAGVTNVTPR